MAFGLWKPQQPSLQSKAFHVNQNISFFYRNKIFVGKIEKLLINSAIVSLSVNPDIDTLERTVISYQNLIVI